MHFLTRSSQPGRPVPLRALVSMEIIFPVGYASYLSNSIDNVGSSIIHTAELKIIKLLTPNSYIEIYQLMP